VRAYAYTGLDPDNENQRNFHSFLARSGYRVVSKDIRKYGDGKVKANLDIELVVDMMKTARNLDIAIVVSGDGDFAPAIRAVQEQGVRVEVISFRGNTSSDLIEVADQFTDITALAKVEKGSSRSGRRVAQAGEDEDLSMTEVPDKQTEGTGDRRARGGRGRGGRTRSAEAEPARRTSRVESRPAVAVTSDGTPLVVLPGEKLSKVAPGPAVDAAGPEAKSAIEPADEEAAAASTPFEPRADGTEDAEGGRRRRRRGGRGRGRGRGRGEGDAREAVESPPQAGVPSLASAQDEEEEIYQAPQRPRTTPFGSVWDSQLGVPSQTPAAASGALPPLGDDEDFDEPEIPEYLLAERRNQGRNQGPAGGRGQGRGGARGARGGYAAAMDRERYGRGGGGGINRYPDVSGREQERSRPQRREDRPAGQAPSGGAPRGGEEWTEVPPELEAMLRAQLGTAPGRRRQDDRQPAGRPSAPVAGMGDEIETFRETPEEAPAAEATTAPEAAPARRRAGRPAASADVASAPALEEPAPTRRRTTRKPAASGPDVGSAAMDGESPVDAPTAPKRRPTRRKPEAEAGAAAVPDLEAPAPRRRTTRRTTEATEEAATTAEPVAADSEAAPKRRTTRRKASEPAPDA
ncbi:MAG TPA: NYN domain-containing protein, partial [Vitreimonas sp.]|nr:NYN domain-containing protein [Vitreimonas sp.]